MNIVLIRWRKTRVRSHALLELSVRSAVAQIDPSHAGLRRNTYTHCRELAAARRRRESERGEQSPKRPRVAGDQTFVGLNNVGGDPPSAVVDAATIAARLNGP